MRKSVVYICSAGLLFCLVTLLAGRRSSSTAGQSSVHETAAVVIGASGKSVAALAGRVTAAGLNGKTLIQQITEALNSGNPGDEAMIFTNQFLALIASDPWAAARLAESPELGKWRTELMRVLAENWAKSNPTEAAKWVAVLTNPDERDTMLSCLCFHVTDPSVAVQILEQQGLNDRRETVLDNLVQQWASQDLPGAFAWADSYPPGADRDNLLKRIALGESQNAPSQAARIVVYNIPPGPVQNEAAFLVLDRWAQQDWDEAAAWANLFPSGELYDQGQTVLKNVISSQTTQDSPTRIMPQ